MGCGSSVESDVSTASTFNGEVHFVANLTAVDRVIRPEKPVRRNSVVVFVDQPSPESPSAERRHRLLLRQESELLVHSVYSSCVQPLKETQCDSPQSPAANHREEPHFAEAESPNLNCSLCFQWSLSQKTAAEVIAETTFGDFVESRGPSGSCSRKTSSTILFREGDYGVSSVARMDAEIAALEAELAALEADEMKNI